MKTFVISSAFILALSFFGSVAYANSDAFSKEGCQIPPARPTGGATRERLQAIQRCYEARPREQQVPNTSSVIQPSLTSSREGCQIPPARPTGGATRERLQAIQQCYEARSREQQVPNTSSMMQLNPPDTGTLSTPQN